jgi:flavin-dependent dehydrogenase
MIAEVDILVAGGGPAGCVAAAGLARRGFKVVLLTRPRSPAVVEGLSQRVVCALEGASLVRALAALGPAVRREASWNGVTSGANREWVVERARFDRALLEDAGTAGVTVVQAAPGPLRREGGLWRAGEGGPRARLLVEARGRRAPGPRRRGPAAVALIQSWSGLPAVARTALAPFADGWAWLAGDGSGSATIQVVLGDAGGRPDLRARLGGALAICPEARAWVEGGRPASRVVARHAGMSRAVSAIDAGRIRIGDAALALDPLAGHGVFEAVASATAAVAVVATILERPGDADLARTFHAERVEHAFLRFARTARDFYRLEERWPERPFWRARRDWPDDLPAHAAPGSAPPRIEARPVIEDGLVALRKVVVTADWPRGVFQVAGVPLVDLLDDWHKGTVTSSEAAAQRFARTPAEAATALAWLGRRGLLTPD